jgi:hypothetical protein
VATLLKALFCDTSLGGTASSNPAQRHGCVSVVECSVLSGRGLCEGSITRPKEY